MKNKKFIVISVLLMLYIALGGVFYFSDLNVQQRGFSCPNTFDIQEVASNMTTEELIHYSEKHCVRNRSTFDSQEITTAIAMTVLWLPLIIAQGFNTNYIASPHINLLQTLLVKSLNLSI